MTDMNDLNMLINGFKGAKVAVIGDIMLDCFVYGDVSRISPEGPIPVLHIEKQQEMLGGAGNVFANLQALGVQTTLIGVIGKDENGKALEKLTDLEGCKAILIEEKGRRTILKTRYIAQNQQLLRVDSESKAAIDNKTQAEILKKAQKIIKTSNVLILSDYNKGTLTPDLIQSLIQFANDNKVKVIVDPKGTDYSIYKGAYVVTPNKGELSAASGMATDSDDNVSQAAQKIIHEAGVDNILATRAADGISVVEHDGQITHFPTQALEVYDVSGAGDTVVAVTAASLAVGSDLKAAAQLANKAGALVVAKLGTATISAKELAGADTGSALVEDWDLAKEMIAEWKNKGLKVGFTNGCFDIIHHGHVSYLAQAKERCDRLIIGLNHDQSVKILKGELRPINDEQARASVLKALASVDMVVSFGAQKTNEDNTPSAVIGELKPDVIFKGGDYTIDQLPEAKVAMAYGGTVDIMPLYEGYSTTNIIKKSATS